MTTCKKVTNAGEGVSVSVATILGKPTMYVVCCFVAAIVVIVGVARLAQFC